MRSIRYGMQALAFRGKEGDGTKRWFVIAFLGIGVFLLYDCGHHSGTIKYQGSIWAK